MTVNPFINEIRIPTSELFIYLLLCLLSMVFSIRAFAIESEFQKPSQTHFKIAFLNNDPPLSTRLPNGEPAGYLIEFWQLWATTNQLSIEWIGGSYDENIEALQTGDVDFQAGLFVSGKRLQWADFSTPIGQISTAVYFPSGAYQGQKLSLKDTPKISVGRGSLQEELLKHKYPEIKILPFLNGKKAIHEVLNGKIDAIVAEVPYINATLGIMGIQGALVKSEQPFAQNTEHAMFLKSRRGLKVVINNGIKHIALNEIQNLERKWFQGEPSYFKNLINPKVPSLSLSQLDWLTTHPTFSIGISSDLAPFEFLDKNGQYQGIGAEYITRIERMLDIKFRPEKNLNWNQVLTAIKQGTIDLLPMAVKTAERSKYLTFTDSYLSFPLVIATHKRSPIIKGLSALSGKTVAVEKGNPAEDLLKRDYPEIKQVVFDRVADAMQSLEAEKVDALVHNSAIISHLQKDGGYENIQIAAFTQYDLMISMAARKGLEPLVGILEKSLRQIGNKERSSINNQWLAIQLDFGTKLKKFLRWTLPISAVLILFFLYLVRNNRRLQLEVNKRRKVERLLASAKRDAEQANQAKDDFLANMSHEIRTPMNAVIGMSDLLSLSDISVTQRKYIEKLKSSSKSLLSLVNKILDLSKIQAGKLDIESVEFNLHLMLKKILNQSRSETKDRTIAYRLSISKEVPEILMGDELRLSQITSRLMNNAEKYTEKGAIKLSVCVDRKDDSRIFLHFVVSDTGVGIRQQVINKIFSDSNQQDTSFEQKNAANIGLAICHQLCQLMNGKIWVHSKVGSGSQFHFIVQFNEALAYRTTPEVLVKSRKNAPKKVADGEFTEQLKGKRILLVDDNETNRIIAQKMLERVGILVVTAQNGVECLLILSQSSFDGVLMDLQMPIMDGFLATEKIRENKAFDALPIIALSANVAREDIDSAISAGMNRHLPKPIAMNALYSTLIELVC